VTLVLTLLCHGCPLQAIVVAFGFDERTVARWQARAGHHCQHVHEHLVSQGGVELGHVQADELWVKLVGRGVWRVMARAVPSRLGLGGVVSPHRDRALIMRLVSMVHACARSLAILVCVDGLRAYGTAVLRVFRYPVRTGRRGRPRLVVEPGLLLGQVIKRYARRRVVKVVQRVVRVGQPKRSPRYRPPPAEEPPLILPTSNGLMPPFGALLHPWCAGDVPLPTRKQC
jgi:hypothetical protein